MDLDQYLTSDATTLAGLVAAKEVTASELLALARERSDAVNPTINAVVMPLTRVADSRAADPGLTGPFAGVPFLIKDLAQEYAGFPTSSGSRALAHDVATEHALVTRRFLEAGLVIFGKTNTPEFGAKGITESTLWGPARNPWDVSRTPGGSSGGSGAAVAAGIVPAAGANDGGGSIRIPAACNGLVGLKTSRGIGPYGPQTGELMFGMVTQGVLSRTVRDSAALLDAIIAPDAGAAYEGALPPVPFAEAIRRAPGTLAHRVVRGVRDQRPPRPRGGARGRGGSDPAGRARPRGRGGHPAARRRGPGPRLPHHLVRPALRPDRRRPQALRRSATATSRPTRWRRPSSGGRPASGPSSRRSRTSTPTPAPWPGSTRPTTSSSRRPSRSRRWPSGSLDSSRSLQRAARVVSRTRSGKLLAASGVLDQIIADNLSWVPYTQLANLTGRPAISVPLHWTNAGLPLGVQLVGRLGADGLLLQVAAQLEEAQPWFHRYAELDPVLDRAAGTGARTA